MTSKKPAQTKASEKFVTRFSLKFWILTPFFFLLVLLILIPIGFFRVTGVVLVELLVLSILLMAAAVGLGLWVARQISRRISQIRNAAGHVARGDLMVVIDDDTNDEIGYLVRAFNQMVADLRRLHYGRDLLSRTMSPAVRQYLLEKGIDFRGNIQVVSMLFIDIRDFTRITEGHSAEQVVFFLNDYYTTIAQQVHSGGGIIGKYGGDSILAYFGAPHPEPPIKSSTAALLTALALQDAIEEMSQRWNILDLPPIRVGIGVSIGPVVAGPIGSAEQFEYTIIGDPVNLAARLQDLTRNVPDFNIIISSEVYEALEERLKVQVQVISRREYDYLDERERAIRPVQFVDLGEVLVKGKRGPVHVFGIPA